MFFWVKTKGQSNSPTLLLSLNTPLPQPSINLNLTPRSFLPTLSPPINELYINEVIDE